ncbi:MAG: hypothetical protein IT303_13325 [Dehalococcoidia bacterium]|nr:hypothetical protein [Dehalococcoidia bacterium]
MYELETEKAVSYTVLTPDRGFNINRIPAPTTSAQQEMLAMIESLVK